jgi:hypothetical protein
VFENRPPMPWRDEPSPWAEPDTERTQRIEPLRPVLPPPPTPPPPRGDRRTGLSLILIGALIGGAVGIGGARALTPQLFPNAAGAPAPAATGTTPAAADPATQAAVKDVLRKANAAQAAAFASHDPAAMKATSTAAHYAEMVKINADLAAGGVTGITLVDMTFGMIAVNGATATATATETWSSTYADGTTDRSTDQNDYELVLENGGWKISTNTQPNAVPGGSGTAPTTPVNPQAPTSGVVQSTSRNWSGYVATGGTYTSVTGTWVVPQPDPKTPGIDATWVGIGGANTTDLIQAGTEATVNPDGTVTYDAWTETLPQSTRTVTLTVNPGDTVTVTLTEQSAGSWLIEMRNNTTNRTYTTTLRYNSSKSSAEWIQEAPSVGRGVAPLDSFGTVKFSGASTVVDGKKQTLRAAGARPVTMTNGSNQALAVPTTIGSDGASFNVDRTSTPSTGGGTGGAPGRRRG